MAEQAMIEEMARAISNALEDFGVYDRHTKAARAAYSALEKHLLATKFERSIRATLTKGDTDNSDRSHL